MASAERCEKEEGKCKSCNVVAYVTYK